MSDWADFSSFEGSTSTPANGDSSWADFGSFEGASGTPQSGTSFTTPKSEDFSAFNQENGIENGIEKQDLSSSNSAKSEPTIDTKVIEASVDETIPQLSQEQPVSSQEVVKAEDAVVASSQKFPTINSSFADNEDDDDEDYDEDDDEFFKLKPLDVPKPPKDFQMPTQYEGELTDSQLENEIILPPSSTEFEPANGVNHSEEDFDDFGAPNTNQEDLFADFDHSTSQSPAQEDLFALPPASISPELPNISDSTNNNDIESNNAGLEEFKKDEKPTETPAQESTEVTETNEPTTHLAISEEHELQEGHTVDSLVQPETEPSVEVVENFVTTNEDDLSFVSQSPEQYSSPIEPHNQETAEASQLNGVDITESVVVSTEEVQSEMEVSSELLTDKSADPEFDDFQSSTPPPSQTESSSDDPTMSVQQDLSDKTYPVDGTGHKEPTTEGNSGMVNTDVEGGFETFGAFPASSTSQIDNSTDVDDGKTSNLEDDSALAASESFGGQQNESFGPVETNLPTYNFEEQPTTENIASSTDIDGTGDFECTAPADKNDDFAEFDDSTTGESKKDDGFANFDDHTTESPNEDNTNERFADFAPTTTGPQDGDFNEVEMPAQAQLNKSASDDGFADFDTPEPTSTDEFADFETGNTGTSVQDSTKNVEFDDFGDFESSTNTNNGGADDFDDFGDFPEVPAKTAPVPTNTAAPVPNHATETQENVISLYVGSQSEMEAKIAEALSSLNHLGFSASAHSDSSSQKSIEILASSLLSTKWEPRDSKKAPKPQFRGTTFETNFLQAIGKQPLPTVNSSFMSFSKLSVNTRRSSDPKAFSKASMPVLDAASASAALGLSTSVASSSSNTPILTPSLTPQIATPDLNTSMIQPQSTSVPMLATTPVDIQLAPMDFSMFGGSNQSSKSSTPAIFQEDSSWMKAFENAPVVAAPVVMSSPAPTRSPKLEMNNNFLMTKPVMAEPVGVKPPQTTAARVTSMLNDIKDTPMRTFDAEVQPAFEEGDVAGPIVWDLLKAIPNVSYMISPTIVIPRK